MKLAKTPVLEKIPLAGISSFSVREFRQPAFRYPWHQHPEIELTWIARGDGLRYVGNSIEPFHAGDCCLIGFNLPHTWLSSGASRGGVRSVVVQFDPSRWGGGFGGTPEMAGIASLLNSAARGVHFTRLSPGSISRLRALSREGPALQRLLHFLELLDRLSREPSRPLSLTGGTQGLRARDDRRLQRVLACLANPADSIISQAAAAELIQLSPPAFSRFFRRVMGRNFQAYVTDLRLGEVCRQLIETDRSISEIAYASGFENLSNFNRAFRLSRGISPGEFRKQSAAASRPEHPA